MSDKDKIKKNPDICENETADSTTPATDVYDSIKCRIKETNVDIPTEEAVEKAKEWVELEELKRNEIKELGYAKTEINKTYPTLF